MYYYPHTPISPQINYCINKIKQQQVEEEEEEEEQYTSFRTCSSMRSSRVLYSSESGDCDLGGDRERERKRKVEDEEEEEIHVSFFSSVFSSATGEHGDLERERDIKRTE